MTKSNEAVRTLVSRIVAGKRPTPWWYWGRAVYVSRRATIGNYKIFSLGWNSARRDRSFVSCADGVQAAIVLAAIGLLLLAYSLFGLYRMYGQPGAAVHPAAGGLGRTKR